MADGRVLRAFVLAPLAAPLGYWVGLMVLSVVRGVRGAGNVATASQALTALGYTLAVGAPIAYAVTLAVGLPAYVGLRRAGLLRRGLVLPIGGALGVATAMLLAPGLRGELLSLPLPPWAGALLGLASAATFWRLAFGRGRAPGAAER